MEKKTEKEKKTQDTEEEETEAVLSNDLRRSCKENHMDAMRDAFLATAPAEREPYERKSAGIAI